LKKIFWCWGWTSPCELPTCVASALLLSHTQLLLLLFHLLLFTAKLIHINIGLFIDFIWLYILKTLIWIVYMSSVFPQASIYLPTSMPPFLPPFFPPTHLSIIYLPGSAGDETQSLCMLGKCSNTEWHSQPLVFFFGSPGVWTQGFTLARQVLYCLKSSLQPFVLWLFWI
jgi:hypothetical protein